MRINKKLLPKTAIKKKYHDPKEYVEINVENVSAVLLTLFFGTIAGVIVFWGVTAVSTSKEEAARWDSICAKIADDPNKLYVSSNPDPHKDNKQCVFRDSKGAWQRIDI